MLHFKRGFFYFCAEKTSTKAYLQLTMPDTQTRYYGIDLFRLIGAFFIMFLHTGYGVLPEEYTGYIYLSARWAVPFFFMASGYFLAIKITQSGELPLLSIERTLLKLIALLLVASLVYLPFVFLKKQSIALEMLFTGSYFHLWFIGSLIFGNLIIWFFYRIQQQKILFLLAISILLLAILSDNYTEKGVLPDYTVFRFMLSIPFMLFGVFLRRFSRVLSYWKIFAIIVLIFIPIQSVEYLFSVKNNSLPQLLLSTVLLSIAIFLLAASLPIRESSLSVWGQKYSLPLYLYHPLVYAFLSFSGGILYPEYKPFIVMFNPIIAFVISLLVIIFLERYMPALFRLLNGDWELKQQSGEK